MSSGGRGDIQQSAYDRLNQARRAVDEANRLRESQAKSGAGAKHPRSATERAPQAEVSPSQGETAASESGAVAALPAPLRAYRMTSRMQPEVEDAVVIEDHPKEK